MALILNALQSLHKASIKYFCIFTAFFPGPALTRWNPNRRRTASSASYSMTRPRLQSHPQPGETTKGQNLPTMTLIVMRQKRATMTRAMWNGERSHRHSVCCVVPSGPKMILMPSMLLWPRRQQGNRIRSRTQIPVQRSWWRRDGVRRSCRHTTRRCRRWLQNSGMLSVSS